MQQRRIIFMIGWLFYFYTPLLSFVIISSRKGEGKISTVGRHLVKLCQTGVPIVQRQSPSRLLASEDFSCIFLQKVLRASRQWLSCHYGKHFSMRDLAPCET